MSKSGKKEGRSRTGRYWLIRIFVVLFGLLLILPLLFYLTMTIVSALSRPEDAKAAKKRGDELLEARNRTILTVSAHPDDVDYWAAGTLARLHQNGNIIIMIVGTSGERGNSTPNLGEIREREQQKAGEIIGYDRIVFLRHPDRRLKADKEFKDELRELFKQYRPDILFAFDIEKEAYIYHHSDHRAAGLAAHAVAPEFRSIKKIYQFHSKAPNVIVDVSDVVDTKVDAMDAHSSVRGQNNSLIRVLLAVYGLFRRGGDTDYRQYGLDISFQQDLDVEYAEIFRVIDNHAE